MLVKHRWSNTGAEERRGGGGTWRMWRASFWWLRCAYSSAVIPSLDCSPTCHPAPRVRPCLPPRGRAGQARRRGGRGAGLGARGEEKAEDAGAPAVGGDVQRGDAVGVQQVQAAPGLLQSRQPLEPRNVVLPRGLSASMSAQRRAGRSHGPAAGRTWAHTRASASSSGPSPILPARRAPSAARRAWCAWERDMWRGARGGETAPGAAPEDLWRGEGLERHAAKRPKRHPARGARRG